MCFVSAFITVPTGMKISGKKYPYIIVSQDPRVICYKSAVGVGYFETHIHYK